MNSLKSRDINFGEFKKWCAREGSKGYNELLRIRQHKMQHEKLAHYLEVQKKIEKILLGEDQRLIDLYILAGFYLLAVSNIT